MYRNAAVWVWSSLERTVCSPHGEQIVVWTKFNHLADRLRPDSSLSKGSLCGMLMYLFISAGLVDSGVLGWGRGWGHFLSVLFPSFHYVIFHVFSIESLFRWKACDLCLSSGGTEVEHQHQTLTLRGPDGLLVSGTSLMTQHEQYSAIRLVLWVVFDRLTDWLHLVVVFIDSFKFVF